MPEITFVQPDGTSAVVDAPVGVSLMKTALANSIPGILAECGGCCMCATCHVQLELPAATPPAAIGAEEEELLECTACPSSAASRLSCQVTVTEEHHGLVVRVPEAQI